MSVVRNIEDVRDRYNYYQSVRLDRDEPYLPWLDYLKEYVQYDFVKEEIKRLEGNHIPAPTPPTPEATCYEADTPIPERHISAFDTQQGGEHYKKYKIQPMQYFMANNMKYPEASIVGYVTRWREKGGTEDLKKARHTLDMIIEAVEKGEYD